MNQAMARTIAWRAFVIAFMLNTLCPARAQQPAASYPAMAPLQEYLMTNRAAEVALARSAAPASISRDATVLVLGLHGYETASKGTNGFVCVVERSWMSPYKSAEFWNPKMRGPICFNPAAARSILPITYERTRLVLAGASKAELIAGIQDAAVKKKLPPLAPGAMSYMMSSKSYLGDSFGHWRPHLMIYVPRTKDATWGQNLPNSPVLATPQFDDSPDPITVLMITLPTWADGTPAASASTH